MSTTNFSSARSLLAHYPMFVSRIACNTVYQRARQLSDSLTQALDHRAFKGLWDGYCEPEDFVPEFEYYAQIDAAMRAAVRLLSNYLICTSWIGEPHLTADRAAMVSAFKVYGYDENALDELFAWAKDRGGAGAIALLKFVHSREWHAACPINEGLEGEIERTSGALIAGFRHNNQKYFKVRFAGDTRTYLVIAKSGREAYGLINRIVRAYRTWSNDSVELDVRLAAKENRRSILYAKDGFVMLAGDARSASSVAGAAMRALGL